MNFRSANVGGTPVHWACAGNNTDGLALLLARFYAILHAFG